MYQMTVGKKYYRKGIKANHRRIFITSLLVILIIVLMLSLSSMGSRPIKFTKIKVGKGDTLWSIASNYAGRETDPRKLISRIKEFNQLQSVILQPGQVIKIPLR